MLYARSLTSMVRSLYGKSRKVLVLDLDNTIWGGVIGDDGADKILIGRETPVAEAYTAFQEWPPVSAQSGCAACSLAQKMMRGSRNKGLNIQIPY